MKFRYGYVSRKTESPRLTPKSAFLRKLERMQRVVLQHEVTVKIIDEVFSKPTGKTLAELFPNAPHLTLVRK